MHHLSRYFISSRSSHQRSSSVGKKRFQFGKMKGGLAWRRRLLQKRFEVARRCMHFQLRRARVDGPSEPSATLFLHDLSQGSKQKANTWEMGHRTKSHLSLTWFSLWRGFANSIRIRKTLGTRHQSDITAPSHFRRLTTDGAEQLSRSFTFNNNSPWEQKISVYLEMPLDSVCGAGNFFFTHSPFSFLSV
jgi:hypothetical protein